MHLLSLQQNLFSSQLEISHMSNGKTLEKQHRKRGANTATDLNCNYNDNELQI
jgi:hypothetical protein